jgi:hypothetical protein
VSLREVGEDLKPTLKDEAGPPQHPRGVSAGGVELGAVCSGTGNAVAGRLCRVYRPLMRRVSLSIRVQRRLDRFFEAFQALRGVFAQVDPHRPPAVLAQCFQVALGLGLL